ncbi:MAG: HPF/RaiA family ribosome-associated protein [Planctomycetota bacterium]|jgi:hypothetical protein
MDFPVHVSFRDLDICEAIESVCWEQAGMLEPWNDRITSCHVTIERTHGRGTAASPMRVRVEAWFDHDAVSVTHETRPGGGGDVALTVRDAFATLRRRLRATDTPQLSATGGRSRSGRLVGEPLMRLPTMSQLTADSGFLLPPR